MMLTAYDRSSEGVYCSDDWIDFKRGSSRPYSPWPGLDCGIGGWRCLLLEGEDSRERLEPLGALRGILTVGFRVWGGLIWDIGLGLIGGMAEIEVSLGPGTALSPSGVRTFDGELVDSSLGLDSLSSSSRS